MSEVVELITVGLASPDGEPITTTGDLPDDLDGLLALVHALVDAGRVVGQLRREVEAKVAAVLGPGRSYEYGDYRYRWGHGYTWKADDDAVGKFLADVAQARPDLLPRLFNPNDIRKTGVEEVAQLIGVDPTVAVDTLLHKKWKPDPGLQKTWIGDTK